MPFFDNERDEQTRKAPRRSTSLANLMLASACEEDDSLSPPTAGTSQYYPRLRPNSGVRSLVLDSTDDQYDQWMPLSRLNSMESTGGKLSVVTAAMSQASSVAAAAAAAAATDGDARDGQEQLPSKESGDNSASIFRRFLKVQAPYGFFVPIDR